MRKVNTTYLSGDECWGVQINGLTHCQDCKWFGISACEGKNIRLRGYNTKGYKVDESGVNPHFYNPEFDCSKTLT